MLRAGLLFFAALLIALMAFFPLSLAIGMMGASGSLLTARAAEGTIWDGVLRDIGVDGVSLGDYSARLSPLALLTGKAAIDLHYLAGPDTKATLVATVANYGVDHITAKLALPGAFDPLPVQTVELRDASVRFAGNRCARAEGQVRVTLSGTIAGFPMGQEMVGNPRCDGDVLSITLASASAMERVTMRVVPDGQYTAKVIIKAADQATALKLAAAGFQETPAGHVMQISGRF
ncbi:MAG: type II secretion system protein N [Sphingomonadaceae bacterium]